MMYTLYIVFKQDNAHCQVHVGEVGEDHERGTNCFYKWIHNKGIDKMITHTRYIP